MTKINALFKEELKVINLGLKYFAEDLKKQGVTSKHVDWRPPAGGNPKMIALLNKLKNK